MVLETLVTLTTNLYLIQGLGFVAFIAGVYAFSKAEDQQLRIWQAIQSFVLALHFYLLGSESAAAMSLITGIRNSISVYKKVRGAAIVFLLIYISVGIYTFNELIDILPVISAVVGTIAVFYLSGIKMRLMMMLSTSLWIVHNTVFLSIGPLLMELIILATTARTTYKLWKPRFKI
jgi:hypothetical protein